MTQIDPEHWIREGLKRNIGLTTLAEQFDLMHCRVAIPGLGGVGGVHLINLIRIGVGRFTICDFDTFELGNFNRQYGANTETIGKKKLDVMVNEAKKINPHVQIKALSEPVSEKNLDDFLEGVDLVVDSLDFYSFDIRRLLFMRAYQKKIPVITAGPIGFSSAMLVFSPGGMNFDQYFGIQTSDSIFDKIAKFAIGLTPQGRQRQYMDYSRVDLEGRAGPSIHSACLLAAALASTEAVKILLRRGNVRSVPSFTQFDPYLGRLFKGRIPFGYSNPLQRLKIFIGRWIFKSLESRSRLSFGPRRPTFEFNRLLGKEIHDPQVVAALLEAAQQAPSGDNTQPWTISWNAQDRQMELKVNPAADGSFFNYKQRASLTALGAAIENVNVFSRSLGFEAQVEMVATSRSENPSYRIRFESGSKVSASQASPPVWIWSRHTNRKKYQPRPLSKWLLEESRAWLRERPEATLFWVHERSRFDEMIHVVRAAEEIRIGRKDIHSFLYSKLWFTRKEALSSKRGFYIKNLEAGQSGDLFLKATRNWALMNTLLKLGMAKPAVEHTVSLARASSALGLITVSGRGPDATVQGGRALQTVWLNLEKYGLSFQPLSPSVLFLNRVVEGGGSDFSSGELKKIEEIRKRFTDVFPMVSIEKDTLVLLFRVGYGGSIQDHTLRQ